MSVTVIDMQSIKSNIFAPMPDAANMIDTIISPEPLLGLSCSNENV